MKAWRIAAIYLVGSIMPPVISLTSAYITLLPATLWAKSEACLEFYNMYLVFMACLFAGLVWFYFQNLPRWLKEKRNTDSLGYKFLFSLYCISNYILMHLLLGTHNMCYGDGQTAMVILPAGAVSSLIVVPAFCIAHNRWIRRAQ